MILMMFKSSLRKNRILNLLIVCSITISITLLVSIYTAINSTKNEYIRASNEQSSSSDIYLISNCDLKINYDNKELKDDSDIKDFIRSYSSDVYYSSAESDLSQIRYISSDLDKEEKYNGITLIEGLFPKKDECLITEKMKSQFGFSIGDSIELKTNSKKEKLTISGITNNKGICFDNLGRCVITDINNSEGYGQVTYKVMVNSNLDKNNAKDKFENKYGDKYRVEYPEGKAEEFLEGTKTLFTGLSIFGVLALIISCSFINSVIKDYVIKNRKIFSIIKAIGGTKREIISIILSRVVFLGMVGVILGVFIGSISSKGLVSYLSGVIDSGDGKITVIQSYSDLLKIAVIGLVIVVLSAIPQSLKGAGETVLSGLMKYKENTKERILKNLILCVGIVFCVVGFMMQNDNTVKSFITLIAILITINIIVELLFSAVIKNIVEVINSHMPDVGLMMKNNIFSTKRKSIELIVLLSLIMAVSIGILLTVNEIVSSLDSIANNQYYGDVLIESDIGVSNDLINKISSVNGVDEVEKNYLKFTDMNDVNVKVKGINIDNKSNPVYGVSENSREKLNDENTLLLSKGLLKKLDKNIGDYISITTYDGDAQFKIVDVINSMEHNGKVIVMDDKNFEKVYKDYQINSVVIFKNGISEDSLIRNLKDSVNDKSVIIDSIDESKEQYISDNRGMTLLFYGITFIVVIAGMLILVNLVSINIKNNEYSLSIEKLLGVSRKNMIGQYIISAIIYGLISGVLGIVFGIAINYTFIKLMNGTGVYNLIFNYSNDIMFGSILLSILLIMSASMISVISNYKQSFKSKAIVY